MLPLAPEILGDACANFAAVFAGAAASLPVLQQALDGGLKAL